MTVSWVEDLRGQAVADGTGRARIDLGGPPTWRTWVVTGLVVDTTGAANPTVTTYKNSEAPFNIIAYTRAGRRDTFRGKALILPGESVFLIFEGASSGSVCTCSLTITNRAGP